MTLTIVLAGIAIMLFFAYFFYTGAQRSSYLLYVVLCLPLMDLWVTPAAFGPMSVFDIITFFSVFLCYRDFIYVGKKNTIYLYLFLIFFTFLFLGSIASEFAVRSLFGVLKLVPPFIYTRLLIKELQEDELFLAKMIKYLKIACLVGVGFMFMQMVVGLQFTFYPALNQNVTDEGSSRLPGFFTDSQLSGVFLSMMSYLFLINLKSPNNPTTANYLSFAGIVLAVMLAGSRSGLLGFAVGLFFLAVFVGGNFRATVLVFGALIGGVLAFFADSFVIFRRFNSMDDSLAFRASIWEGAYQIFKKNYTLGIGANNYRDYAMLHSQDQFLLLDNDEILFLNAPENGYLKYLAEFGLFAFISLFLMIIGPVLNVFYNFMRGKKVIAPFFFIAPILGCLLSFTSFYSFGDSRILIVVCSYTAFMIAYPSDPKPANEE
jgi:O-antigen ligase